MIGEQIYSLAKKLWGINRSITGEGVRKTLGIIQEILPELQIHEVPSGAKVFDWTVPQEWRVNNAYIIDPYGKKICDFSVNNLHLVGYSVPIHTKLRLSELQKHLHSIPEQPTAIPYVTSYYKRDWGFCISQLKRESLPDGEYEVVVDTEIFNGSLTYGELLIKGDYEEEVFFSTYVCHPSMANNELSGPVVTTHIAQWLISRESRKFSYRFVFVPETIGSITYLSKNLDLLKSRVFAGFNVSCVGDDRCYSYLPSRNGKTLSDAVAKHVLKYLCPEYKTYQWKDRGSDERQYCSPGIDLPIASIMRTKYGEYPEYHTSLDDLEYVVSPKGLQGGYDALRLAIEVIEANSYPRSTTLCEPQLGKRGLYPTLSTKSSGVNVRLMMDLLTWADGSKSLLDIAELCEVSIWELLPIVEDLLGHQLLTLLHNPSLV